ncbi:hypothetical protein CYMTET_3518, partial [Cymbomonas tetramitiformis]
YRSSSSDDSGERSRGRRRFKKKKKKKKSKKPKKRSKFTAEEKGKARAVVAAEENHSLTPEMAVKTLLKDKALRDQAFECLPAERQRAIASAKAAGEDVHWEQEGWEAMMAAQRTVLQERSTPHPLPVRSPTPKDTNLVWYEHTKALHPTLSEDEAWQLAVHNHTGASTAQTSGTEGGVSSSVSSAQPSGSETAALEEWRYPSVPITVEQGIRDHVRVHNSGVEEATAIAAKYSNLAVSYGHAKNHRVRETLPGPVMQLISDTGYPVPEGAGDASEQEREPPPRSETDPARLEQTQLKKLEAEDRLLSTLRKLRERITTYTCPLDQAAGEKTSGHLLQPLKLLMRELQDYFKEQQVKRALATKKMNEDADGGEATVTTVPEELRLIIRDRVEGSVQGLLNQKVLTNQMNTLDDLSGTLARSCISDAHLSILPSMLSRSRQASGKNAGRNARTFHHALMEAFELMESLHKHGVTGPVSRASLPGIFLSGLTPELHARVHKELLGKVDFHQSTGPAGWEAELLRKYVEQATLEERRDPVGLKAARDQSPFPVAALVECLDEHVEQCYALPTAPAEVEGRQLPGSSTYTGCRKCKSKEHLARACPQQHDQQKKAAWVKCIWDEAFETLENSGASPELMEETFAVIAQERGSDFGEGEAAGASSSPIPKA